MVYIYCEDTRNNNKFLVKNNYDELLKDELIKIANEKKIETIRIIIENNVVIFIFTMVEGTGGYTYRKMEKINEIIDEEYVCYLIKYSYNELYNSEIMYYPLFEDYDKFNEYILDYYDYKNMRILKINNSVKIKKEYYIEKAEIPYELKKKDNEIFHNKEKTNEFDEIFSKINYGDFINYYPNITFISTFEKYIFIYYFDTVIHFIKRTEKTVKEDIQDFYNNFNYTFIRISEEVLKELKDKRIIKVIKTQDTVIIKLNEKGLILRTNEIFEK